MKNARIRSSGYTLLAGVGLTALLVGVNTPVAAQVASESPRSGCSSEAALKDAIRQRFGVAPAGRVESILFKTFQMNPAHGNAYAANTQYTVITEYADAIVEHDREERFLCSSNSSGDCRCVSEGGRQVGERRWKERVRPEVNTAIAAQGTTPAAVQRAPGSAPARPPGACASEAAFKHIISNKYEGTGRRPGDIRVNFKTFEVGAPTPYTDPYHRAVNTKAYPVKTTFTVRHDYSDAVEETDYDSRYLCYQDTRGECVCILQMGGSTGKTRHIPK